MYKVKNYLSILIVVFSCSCSSSVEQTNQEPLELPDLTPIVKEHVKDSIAIAEMEAADLVKDLPEVQELGKMITSNNGHSLKYMMEKTAEPGCIEVRVMEDNGESMVTGYVFNVYPGQKRIEVYDAVEDRYISLDKWRKKGKI